MTSAETARMMDCREHPGNTYISNTRIKCKLFKGDGSN